MSSSLAAHGNATPDDASPVDRQALLARCNGSEKRLREVVTLFLDTHRAHLAEIEDAIRRSDAAALQRSARSLGGTLSALGADAAAWAAVQLVRIGRDCRFDHVAAAYADLVESLEPVTAALARIVGRNA